MAKAKNPYDPYEEEDPTEIDNKALLSLMGSGMVNKPSDAFAPGPPSDYAPPPNNAGTPIYNGAAATPAPTSTPIPGTNATTTSPFVPNLPASSAGATSPLVPGAMALGNGAAYAPNYDWASSWNPSKMTTGWDNKKWSDPTHNSVKYLAGRYMSTMDPTADNLAKVADYLKSQGYGVNYNPGDDTFTLSGKELNAPVTIDAIQGMKSGNPMWNWLDAGAAAAGAAGAAGAGSAGAGAGAAAGGANATPYAGVTDAAGKSKFLGVLEGLMGFDPASVSLDSPGIREQSDVVRADLQRARRDKQAGLAELYAQQGLGTSGALDADVASSYDTMGQQIARADSELIANEVKAQRDQMMQALAMYGGLLSDDQRNALSWKIAQMEDYISRLQVGYNYDALEGNLNNDAIRILLGA